MKTLIRTEQNAFGVLGEFTNQFFAFGKRLTALRLLANAAQGAKFMVRPFQTCALSPNYINCSDKLHSLISQILFASQPPQLPLL